MMQVNKNVFFIIKQNYILVFLNKKLFFKQYILKESPNCNKNVDYTFFFVILVLYKFGLVHFN